MWVPTQGSLNLALEALVLAAVDSEGGADQSQNGGDDEEYEYLFHE